MPSRLLFPSLIAALIALCACQEKPKPVEPPPVKLETRRFERSLPGCGDKSKREEPCVTFRIEWPEVVEAAAAGEKAAEAKARMNAAILSRMQPAEAPKGFEAEAAQVIADYERFRDQFPASSVNYFTRRVAEAVLVGRTLLSVQITAEEYRGGAHPEATREYLNLNPATGERVELPSLARGGGMERLTAVAERYFRAERGLEADQNLKEAGFAFEDNRFALPAQWGAEARGLVFHFNAYEVAPYAAGPTTFTVPWSELGDILRKDSGLPPATR